MKFIDKIKRHKYFRYDLFVNNGDGWKQFGDGFKEYLEYKDIENPDPGALLRFYGVYKDLDQKNGWGRDMMWEKIVPMPGGGKSAAGGSKKEKPIEERLMERIMEGADFSGLKPSKMSLPFGKSGGTLDFESPVVVPGGGDGSGYVIIDGNRYSMGEMPALEFEGKLPAWLHPAAGALIMGLMDRAGGFLKGAIGGAITDATGIKAKKSNAGQIDEKGKSIEEPPDSVAELDSILEEAEEKVEKNVEKKKVK